MCDASNGWIQRLRIPQFCESSLNVLNNFGNIFGCDAKKIGLPWKE
jgi:hypothetical protein